MRERVPLAVMGGTGFYEMPGLESVEEIQVETPFGEPSDAVRIGTIGGTRVAFLARHGREHRILPSEIPQRANFWALKSLGVERVLAVSAVGSLREEFEPGQFVAPDQLVDRTRGPRPSTFFGDGVVAHIGFAEPFCPVLRGAMIEACGLASATVHDGGTSVVVEGPAFGTKAESELYRSWGMGIVGMTALPEAKLAREAELCYTILAAVTDYDAWHDDHDAVQADTIFEVLQRNAGVSQAVVAALATNLPAGACECGTALDAALVTEPSTVDSGTRERLRPLLRRRLGMEDE